MRISLNKSVAVGKLCDELAALGIPSIVTDDDVQVNDATTAAQQGQILAVIAAHDPTPTRAQRLREIGLTEREAALLLLLRQAAGGPQAPAWSRAVASAFTSAIDAALS
jgi:hypothetical protein